MTLRWLISLVVLFSASVSFASSRKDTEAELTQIYTQAFGAAPIDFQSESVFFVHRIMSPTQEQRAFQLWFELYSDVLRSGSVEEQKALLRGEFGKLPVLGLHDLIVLDEQHDQFAKLFWEALTPDTISLLKAKLRSHRENSPVGERLAARLAESFLSTDQSAAALNSFLTFAGFTKDNVYYKPPLAKTFMMNLLRALAVQPPRVREKFENRIVEAYQKNYTYPDKLFLLEELGHLKGDSATRNIGDLIESFDEHNERALETALQRTSNPELLQKVLSSVMSLGQARAMKPREVRQFHLYSRVIVRELNLSSNNGGSRLSRDQFREIVHKLMMANDTSVRSFAVGLLWADLFSRSELENLLAKAATDVSAKVRDRVVSLASYSTLPKLPWYKFLLVTLADDSDQGVAREANEALQKAYGKRPDACAQTIGYSPGT